jgi:DNA-binding response OmpR family regulator
MEKPIKIIVVDDDVNLLFATARILTSAGYEVDTATGGVEGLEKIRAGRPDLVLLDVVMPDIDGITVCRQIKSDPELRNVYVILLSSMKTETGQQANGLESGADGYIARPIDKRELLARVEAMIRIKRVQNVLAESEAQNRQLQKAQSLGRMAGAVTVESALHRGSTFQVFFPVSGEEVTRQPDKAAPVPEIAGGGTILLVEDEEMVRNMAAAMLTCLGFTVLKAKDGVEAVEVFRKRQERIRFVLCDLTMPRMNGWETLTALRKLAPDIKVILASGYDKAHVMAGDHPELPQAFIGKPYNLKGLSDAISQVLSNPHNFFVVV